MESIDSVKSNDVDNIYCDKRDRMIRYLDDVLEDIFENENEIKLNINIRESRLKEAFETIELAEKQADPNGIFFTPQVSQRTKFSNSLGSEITKITKELSELKKEQRIIKEKRNNINEIILYLKEHNLSDEITNEALKTSSESAADELHIKMLEIQENERNRIARDIHDSTVQNLTSLVHKAELCTKLVDRDPIRTKLEIQTMIGTIRGAIDDLRMIIYNLRPMSIDDIGLVVTVERHIQNLMLKENIHVEFNVVNNEVKLLPIINLTIYRIIQEACNNVVKHAKAKNIYIKLSYLTKKLEVIIEDDGVGLGNEQSDEEKNDLSGLGLSIMKERVFLLSGNIVIMKREEGGTRIIVTVPIS